MHTFNALTIKYTYYIVCLYNKNTHRTIKLSNSLKYSYKKHNMNTKIHKEAVSSSAFVFEAK